MTPILEEYGLVFNKHWKLMICRSCQEGLPFRCVPAHLAASRLPRWDNSKCKIADTATNHIAVPSMKTGSVAANKFNDAIAESLINSGYITSKSDIMDAGTSSDWGQNFQSLPDKPVEGIAVFNGWVDGSGYALRNKRGYRKRIPPIIECLVQTFTETAGFQQFFPVYSTLQVEEEPERIACTPMDLLRSEKSLLLSQIPSLGKSADRRAILPIFFDSGIETWLGQFDCSTLYSKLPQCPAAGKRSTPKPYTRLAKTNLILIGEDMKALSESHHSIRHAITNCTRWVTCMIPFMVTSNCQLMNIQWSSTSKAIQATYPCEECNGLPERRALIYLEPPHVSSTTRQAKWLTFHSCIRFRRGCIGSPAKFGSCPSFTAWRY